MYGVPHRPFITKMVGLFFTLLFLSFMSGTVPPVLAATTATNTQPMYVDQKLGFSLQLPVGWVATPSLGKAQNNSSVIFTNASMAGTILQIGVMRSSIASKDFARRGRPTLYIGGYPAFQADTHAGKQVPVSCLVRVMLARNDTVIATWCAKDAFTHTRQFEGILATYHDHSILLAMSGAVNKLNMIAQNAPVNPVLSCSQVIQQPGPNMWGSLPSNDPSFGQQIVNPTDSTWTNHFGEGVAVCNDDNWEHSYLFQCVELANRFINEEWGLSEFTVDAFAYYDSYQGGTFYQGQARTLFGSQVQLTDDASQGNNSAPPVPGDLLIFQDVTDSAHWTSGEIAGDPGHVVVVTTVTSTQVTVTQQNWQYGEIHTFVLQHWNNGYHIVDNSGWTGRITRGWIHFNANGGSSTSPGSDPFLSSNGQGGTGLQAGYLPGSLTPLDIFGKDTSHNIWNNWKTGDANSPWAGWGSLGQPSGVQLSNLTVGTFSDGRLNIFATGSDGNIWNQYKLTTALNSLWSGWSSLGQAGGGLTGQVQVGTLPDGRMDLFVLGADSNVWENYKTTTDVNSLWSGWGSLGNPGVPLTSLSAGSFSDGLLNIFAVGSDGNVWNMYKLSSDSNAQWSGWTDQGQTGGGLLGQVQIGTLPNGAMNLFVLGKDNNVWNMWKTTTSDNAPWSGWQSLGNPGVQLTSITIGKFSDGRLNVFATGSDGNIWNQYKLTTETTSFWSGWGSLGQAGNGFSTSQIQVGMLADGRISLFVVGTDNNLWEVYKTTTDTNSPWSGWQSLGQPSGGLAQS